MSEEKNQAPEAMERMQESTGQVAGQGEAVVEEADDGRRAVVAEDPGPAGAESVSHEDEGQVGERAQSVEPNGANAQQTTEAQEAAVVGGSMLAEKSVPKENTSSARIVAAAEGAMPVQVAAGNAAPAQVAAEAGSPMPVQVAAAVKGSPSGQMVTCGVIRDLLPLYVDDVVGAETKAMVDAHLQACPGCRGYLDGMRSVVQIPVTTKQRLEDAKVLRALKRFIRNKRLLTGLGTAVVVFAACCLAVGLMNSYRWDVPYSEDITVYKSTDGFVCLQYTGAGHISFDTSWDDDGVMRVSCQQSFWDRYVEPIYDNALENYWLAESREIVEVHYYDTAEEMWNVNDEGEIVWEADDQDKRDFYERERSLDQKQDDLEELYRQMDEIQERIWELEDDQEWNDRVVG